MKVFKDKKGLFYYKKRKINGKIVKKKIRIRMKTKQKQTQRQSQKVVINNIIGKESKTKRRRKKKGLTGMISNKQKDDEYLSNMKAEVYRAQQKAEGKDNAAMQKKVDNYQRAFEQVMRSRNYNNARSVKAETSTPRSPIMTRSLSGSYYAKRPPSYPSSPGRDKKKKDDIEEQDLQDTLDDLDIDIPKSDSKGLPDEPEETSAKKYSDEPRTIGNAQNSGEFILKNYQFKDSDLVKIGVTKTDLGVRSVNAAYRKIADIITPFLSSSDIKLLEKPTKSSHGDFYANRQKVFDIIAKHKSKFGKGSGRGEGIDNISINRDMKKYRVPGFCGCYMSDELKYLPKKKKTFCFIYNTDTSKGKGKHWIGVNITKKSLEYYDPLAGRLRKGFLDSMSKVLRRNGIGQLKLKVNAVRDQRANSDSCGFFSSKFLIDRARGKSFSKASGYSSISKAEKAVGIFRKKFNKYV